MAGAWLISDLALTVQLDERRRFAGAALQAASAYFIKTYVIINDTVPAIGSRIWKLFPRPQDTLRRLRSAPAFGRAVQVRYPHQAAGSALSAVGHLAGAPGELVTREELQQKLWPADTFVDFDTSLNSAIKKLRDAPADSAAASRPSHGVATASSPTSKAPRSPLWL